MTSWYFFCVVLLLSMILDKFIYSKRLDMMLCIYLKAFDGRGYANDFWSSEQDARNPSFGVVGVLVLLMLGVVRWVV